MRTTITNPTTAEPLVSVAPVAGMVEIETLGMPVLLTTDEAHDLANWLANRAEPGHEGSIDLRVGDASISATLVTYPLTLTIDPGPADRIPGLWLGVHLPDQAADNLAAALAMAAAEATATLGLWARD